MKRIGLYFIFLALISFSLAFLFQVEYTFSHSGDTNEYGCHYDSYGVEHCH